MNQMLYVMWNMMKMNGSGCKQGKVDKKNSLFKIQFKNETVFDMDARK